MEAKASKSAWMWETMTSMRYPLGWNRSWISLSLAAFTWV